MLVLSRKLGEEIIIGNDIEVMVTAIQGGRVKLGVTAPQEVVVHRREVYLKIQEHDKQTANTQELPCSP